MLTIKNSLMLFTIKTLLIFLFSYTSAFGNQIYTFNLDPIYLNNEDGILCFQAELSSRDASMPKTALKAEENLRKSFKSIVSSFFIGSAENRANQRSRFVQGKLPELTRLLASEANLLLITADIAISFPTMSGGPKSLSSNELRDVEEGSTKRLANKSGCFKF